VKHPAKLLVAGSLLLVLAAVWKWALAPYWTQRLPAGWAWQADYIGISATPDPATGRFPPEDQAATYQRATRLVPNTAQRHRVRVQDTFIIHDLNTGKITWEYITEATVDPATGAHLEPGLAGEVVVFPRQAEKKTYRLRTNYLKGVPLDYQGEDDIGGLTAYRYAYQGRGEYTESYLGTAQYPGVRIATGQEVKCAEDRFTFTVWVEPLTGEILKIDESCRSGDYLYEIASGQPLGAVLRWGGTTAGDDVLIRCDQVRADRRRLLWFDRYLPAGAALLGGLLLAWAGVGRWSTRKR
jgi:hypothetical protein